MDEDEPEPQPVRSRVPRKTITTQPVYHVAAQDPLPAASIQQAPLVPVQVPPPAVPQPTIIPAASVQPAPLVPAPVPPPAVPQPVQESKDALAEEHVRWMNDARKQLEEQARQLEEQRQAMKALEIVPAKKGWFG